MKLEIRKNCLFRQVEDDLDCKIDFIDEVDYISVIIYSNSAIGLPSSDDMADNDKDDFLATFSLTQSESLFLANFLLSNINKKID